MAAHSRPAYADFRGRGCRLETASDSRLAAFCYAGAQRSAVIVRTLDSILSSAAALRRGWQVGLHVILNDCCDNTEDLVRQWISHNTEAQSGAAALALTIKVLANPGKVLALSSTKQFVQTYGKLPAHIIQIDADTHLQAGQLEALLRRRRGGYCAVGARVWYEQQAAIEPPRARCKLV